MKFYQVLFTVLLSSKVFAQNYYQQTWKDFGKSTAANEKINPQSPNFGLLNAAIFHATNEAREQNRLPIFKYHEILEKSSDNHAQYLLKIGQLSHTGQNNSSPHERIMKLTNEFMGYAENIADFPLLDSPSSFCLERKTNGEYRYFDCKSRQEYQTYSYWKYARTVVNGWMNSPGHRMNILDSKLQYLGCAVRLSPNPFQQKRPPYGILVQNFGGK
ncbi:MAG: CAP domain-containing protein [Spirosomaceae bacterium]|jgi:uncharacterized protein YkwD|nr:CAP domain-containing protein [Spirosomataceae bacterium]